MNEDTKNDELELEIEPEAPPPRKPRGFQAISLERRRAIASSGGRASAALGVSHRWTSETAREAGRKAQRLLRERREGQAST